LEPTASAAQCKARLAELIKEKALRLGDFTLASGQKSNYYIDGRCVTLDGEGAYCIARCILDLLEGTDVEAAGGMSLGADPIAGAVACLAGEQGKPLTAFIVRKQPKDHGTGQQVEGPLRDGARVAVLEDTVTTGGSPLEAAAALEREKHAQIVTMIVLVDRQQGAREKIEAAGYHFQSLFTVEELGVKPLSPGA
jgi:orotate phosphoribosyltransferase